MLLAVLVLASSAVVPSVGSPNTASPSQVYVYALTVATFDGPCPAGLPLYADFHATALGGTGPYNYSWNFGDGSPPSYGPTRVHLYSGSGPYNAMVEVRDASGSSASANTTVEGSGGSGCPSSGTQGSSFLGLPEPVGYGLLAGTAVAVLVVAGVLWRRGGKPPARRVSPASPPKPMG
jgi:hypothetical protein